MIKTKYLQLLHLLLSAIYNINATEILLYFFGYKMGGGLPSTDPSKKADLDVCNCIGSKKPILTVNYTRLNLYICDNSSVSSHLTAK